MEIEDDKAAKQRAKAKAFEEVDDPNEEIPEEKIPAERLHTEIQKINTKMQEVDKSINYQKQVIQTEKEI